MGGPTGGGAVAQGGQASKGGLRRSHDGRRPDVWPQGGQDALHGREEAVEGAEESLPARLPAAARPTAADIKPPQPPRRGHRRGHAQRGGQRRRVDGHKGGCGRAYGVGQPLGAVTRSERDGRHGGKELVQPCQHPPRCSIGGQRRRGGEDARRAGAEVGKGAAEAAAV